MEGAHERGTTPGPATEEQAPSGDGAAPPGAGSDAPSSGPEVDGTGADEGRMAAISGRADAVAERFGKSDWIELMAALLLALATIASAWSAYQATRWGGVQSNSYSSASALRSESIRASNTALAQREVDVSVFVAWLQAVANEQPVLQQFYEARFRAEFKPAFEAWRSTVPQGQVPDGSPFSRPEYVLAEQQKADDLQQRAEDASATARAANQTGDNFILIAVLMASVLFFAGFGTKFQQQAVRRLMIGIASIVFVLGLAAIVSLPQNVGI
jgi:hypothetical protein